MKLEPWQLNILANLRSIKPGEFTIAMSGRNVGKSAFSAQAFQRLWEDLHNRPLEDLKLTEGRVHGARYFCVEPVGGSWFEMEAWCRESFGEPGEIWPTQDFVWPDSTRWMQNNRKFWFRNESDQTMFILKWR